MSRVVRFRAYGGPEVLALEEELLVDPGPGEVRIRVAALGLNRAEALFRAGKYLMQAEFPSRIGYECAGTIDALGLGVEGYAIGDRVGTVPAFHVGRYGVYGDYAVVPARAVVHSPAGLSDEACASIWSQYVTAQGALGEVAKIDASSRVVITAASSSVGIAAIQVAKRAGALTIATTRRADKRAALLALGADHVICTDSESLVDRIRELTDGRGFTVSFDPVVGPFLEMLAVAAAPNAILFVYGGLSPADAIFPRRPVLSKGLWIRGYTLFQIVEDRAAFARVQRYVVEGIESGELRPTIARVFPLDEVVEAHRYLESNEQVGKVIIKV